MTKYTKHLSLSDAVTKRRRYDTMVFTNGTFDLLHAGHIRYLQAARAMGDALFLGLNSDESIAALKGPKRPIMPQADRIEVLAALTCVDYILVFEETTAHTLIEALKPDVYVKGGDYVLEAGHSGTLLPEAPLVQSYGGQVELIPYRDGYATSALIQRITERFCD